MNERTANPFMASEETHANAVRIRRALLNRTPIRAVVVGVGKSGLAAIELLKSRSSVPAAADDRPFESLSAEAKKALGGLQYSALNAAALENAELVVLSPGVPRTRPELASAIERGVLLGELELASWFIKAPMVAITGTNGKSTTTALIAHLFEADGKRVFAGGNLGRPLSELASSAEDVDVAVVEVSSYQLESLVLAQFQVACWLNLTPDHADRYTGLDAYAAAKRRILEQRSVNGVAVLNADDSIVREAGHSAGGVVRWFAAWPQIAAQASSGTILIDSNTAARGEERYNVDNPALPGMHNRANMVAAIECARSGGAERAGVQAGLLTFKGLPHRIELVGRAKGARWYNDSKATNIDSAVTALRGVDGPKILIVGGRDKHAPWTPFSDLAEEHQVKAVLAIGEATEIAIAAFGGKAPIVERSGTLEQAVARAAELAQPGDAVLLSPACASFDQFANYEARGDSFRRLAKALEEKEQR